MSQLETNTTTIQSIINKVNTKAVGIVPTGTLEITENGTYDVTEYASVEVNTGTGAGASVETCTVTFVNCSEQSIYVCGAELLNSETIENTYRSARDNVPITIVKGTIVLISENHAFTRTSLNVTGGVFWGVRTGGAIAEILLMNDNVTIEYTG